MTFAIYLHISYMSQVFSLDPGKIFCMSAKKSAFLGSDLGFIINKNK